MRKLTVILIILFVCADALPAGPDKSIDEKGIFSGSFADAVWTVIAFVVLLVVLGRLAWRPLLNSLKAREDHIKQQLDDAESTRKQAEAVLDEYKQQGLQIVEKAAEQARQQQHVLVEKATQEAIAMKHKVQADIEYAQLAASQQLWRYAGDMLLSISSEILGRAVTHEDNQRLISEAVEKLKENQAGAQK